jgi:hypothetical protein
MTVTSARTQCEFDGLRLRGVTSNMIGVTARVTGVTGLAEDGDRS